MFLLPDTCWRSDMVSGSLFLYFNEQVPVFTLHPSVSTFMTGVDPFAFAAFVDRKRPAWGGQFAAFWRLWDEFRDHLGRTSKALEPLRGSAFKTAWLSYPRDSAAWRRADELLAASSLPPASIYRCIDPWSAADELFSHIFFEKYLELYLPPMADSELVELGRLLSANQPSAAQVDWQPLYEYCDQLFGNAGLEQLLARAYMFRIPLLQDVREVLLSNERLVPFLASLPVDSPEVSAGGSRTGRLDLIAWEFFRQVVSPVVDPLSESSVRTVHNLLKARAAEIARLRNRCYELAVDLAGDDLNYRPLELDDLAARVSVHVRAKVTREIQDALELDDRATQDLISSVFGDAKAWLGVAATLLSIFEGGPLVTAGSVIATLAVLGSNAVAAAAKRKERLRASDFAILYRAR